MYRSPVYPEDRHCYPKGSFTGKQVAETLKPYPMPLFYHGFVPAAILIMLGCLAAKHLYRFWKQLQQKS